MPVVADVDADLGEAQVENRVPEIARAKIELFPKTRRDVWDMRLAVLAEIRAIVLNDGGGVVKDPFLFDFVHGYDHCDAKRFGERSHESHGGSIGDPFRGLIPFDGLLGAKVWAVEDLLQTYDLGAGFCGLANQIEVLLDHGFLLRGQGLRCRQGVRGLDDGTTNQTGHSAPTPMKAYESLTLKHATWDEQLVCSAWASGWVAAGALRRGSVLDFIRRFNPGGEAGPRFVAEQLGGRQLALGGVFSEFRVEKGIVEACTGCVGGTATEINGVEARPIRGGEAHGTGLATCVKRATRKRKGAQSFARGTHGVDLAVGRGVMRCGYGIRTFSY